MKSSRLRGSRWWRSFVACVAGMCALARAGAAHADCISPAYGVPGLPGGPVWVGTGARTVLDDPRWAGATRFYFPSHPVSSPPSSTVRAVVDGNTLIISYQVLADSSASAADTVWLGVGKNATKAAAASGDKDNFLVELSLGPFAVGDAQSFDLGSEHVWSSVDGDPANWLEELNPAYMDKTIARYWTTGGSYVWAVNLRFDLTVAGIDATTRDGKIFVATFMESGFGFGWVDQFPFGTVLVNPTTSTMDFSQSGVDPDNFGAFTLGSYSSPCADGISLTAMQIGAAPAPDSVINGPGGADSTANTFFAHPDWHSVPIVTNAVNARFRIANWGSIADPAALWDGDVANQLNDASGHMDHLCPFGVGLCGGVLPGADDHHQCMLVELSKGTASTIDPLKFANDSVFRNMDFDTTSTLKRQAEISIKGLPALPSTTLRDTYLLVRTVNMPGPTDKELFLPKDAMARAVKLAEHPPQRPQPKQPPIDGKNPPNEGKNQPKPGAAAPPPAGRAAVNPKAAVALPPPLDPDLSKDGFEHLQSTWPTYEVFVFHDSGQFIIANGKKYRRLEQQVPFGYFINHDGPYYGFDHSIQGLAGANLVEIQPDFYKLQIPNGGSAKILTTITALEKPGGAGHGGCRDCCAPPVKVEIKPHCYCALPGVSGSGNAALLSAFGALGVFLARRLRRRSRA